MNGFIKYFNLIKSEPKWFIIPGKAECLGMCPDEEIYTRGEVEFSSVNKFERDEKCLWPVRQMHATCVLPPSSSAHTSIPRYVHVKLETPVRLPR